MPTYTDHCELGRFIDKLRGFQCHELPYDIALEIYTIAAMDVENPDPAEGFVRVMEASEKLGYLKLKPEGCVVMPHSFNPEAKSEAHEIRSLN